MDTTFKSIENLNDVGPSMVMASPSGLQSGLSRQLFDKENAYVVLHLLCGNAKKIFSNFCDSSKPHKCINLVEQFYIPRNYGYQ